jgi:hypothetical protein
MVAAGDVIGEETTRVRVRFLDPQLCAAMAAFIPLLGDVEVRVAADGVTVGLIDC